MKRVVVTGIGIWSCLGQNKEEVTLSLKQGKSGIGIDDARKLRESVKGTGTNPGKKTRLFVYQKDCTLLRKAKSIIQSVVVLT